MFSLATRNAELADTELFFQGELQAFGHNTFVNQMPFEWCRFVCQNPSRINQSHHPWKPALLHNLLYNTWQVFLRNSCTSFLSAEPASPTCLFFMLYHLWNTISQTAPAREAIDIFLTLALTSSLQWGTVFLQINELERGGDPKSLFLTAIALSFSVKKKIQRSGALEKLLQCRSVVEDLSVSLNYLPLDSLS